MLRCDVGNHDSAAVAAQTVTQHLGHHRVPVGYVRSLLSHTPLLKHTCKPVLQMLHWRVESGVAIMSEHQAHSAPFRLSQTACMVREACADLQSLFSSSSSLLEGDWK